MSNTIQHLKNELSQFGKDWDKAIEMNDVSAIAQFMSDDWVIIGTDGGITPKNTFLGFISSGDLKHTKMEFEDLRLIHSIPSAATIAPFHSCSFNLGSLVFTLPLRLSKR